MQIFKNINNIKTFAPYLFFLPLFALLFPVLLNNYLMSYKLYTAIDGDINFNKKPCDEKNNYCRFEIFLKFEDCPKYHVNKIYYLESSNKEVRKKEAIELGEPFYYKYKIFKNIINKGCIKNYKSYKFYKLFPIIGKLYIKIKNKADFGVSKKINPYLYGETSISNLVKRYPFNIIFKPLMMITAFLMIFYWSNYYGLLNKLFPDNKKKNNYFLFFGLMSALLIFFHVLFLGSENQDVFFKLFRRSIIVLFILFEILAEFYLAKTLYNHKTILIKYMYKNIILAKMFFVLTLVFVTVVILLLLIFKNLSSSFDHLIEWHFFNLIPVFYLLSAVAWKTK